MTRNQRHRNPNDGVRRPSGPRRYVLRLYVAGLSTRSAAAIQNVRRICEDCLKGRYDLEVIDLYDHPALARDEQIIAAPTLVKELPLPLRRLIGDMADSNRVLVGLDLRPREENGLDR